MTRTPDLTIDMDQPCVRCKKKGAVNGGMCLKCILKLMPQMFGKKKP